MTGSPWIIHWDVDPEIFRIGSFALRYYSLGFILGFSIGFAYMKSVFQKQGRPVEVLESLLTHIVAGTIIGARLGHCLFYEPEIYLKDPIRIFKVWEGGLASHGGTLGVVIALFIFARKNKNLSVQYLVDEMAFPIAITAGFIRLGNLFNSEIIGRPTGGDWGFVFDRVDNIPRYPAQLIEAIAYFTTALIIFIAQKKSPRMLEPLRRIGLMLLLIYGFRFFIEFLKEVQVSFEESMLFDMGQLLSLPFISFGLWAMLRDIPKKNPDGSKTN